jgi:hypothetical protein
MIRLCRLAPGFEYGLFMRSASQMSVLAVAAMLTAGCSASPSLDATMNQTRVVQASYDAAKTVTVSEAMVWYASASQDYAVRFPPGIYELEATDDDYWYFRCPTPLEFRHFARGNPTSQYTSFGGLMLAKPPLRFVPAAGYVEDEADTKKMVWKLGGDFMAMEGRQWTKSW